ncbi:hypothetical protein WS46_27895 [Burkholderia sp. RF4-BP95]|nr:hypothetical protein WS45_24285 [Burkholderia sp. RF2-non_BP3]KUY72567.1 hypothetical protein WS46_27895 [Burkholderia sp. RF4-BP95]
MSSGFGWQYMVVAILVIGSACFVLCRFARRLTRNSTVDGGCGDGCCGCAADNEAASVARGEQPLRFHLRRPQALSGARSQADALQSMRPTK